MKSMYFHQTRGRTIGQRPKQVKGIKNGFMRSLSNTPVGPNQPRLLVPGGRVELPLSCENRILSPARLPVPPSGQELSKGATSNTKLHKGQSVTPPLFFSGNAMLQ